MRAPSRFLLIFLSITLLATPLAGAALNPAATKAPSQLSPTHATTSKSAATKPGFGPAGRIEYKFVNDRMLRKSAAGKWLATDTRQPKDFDPIRAAAYKSMWSKVKVAQSSRVVLQLYRAPNYPKPLAAILEKQISDYSKLVSPFLDRDLPFDLLLISEKDKTHFDGKLPESIEPGFYNQSLTNLARYATKESFRSSSATGGGTANYLQGKTSAFGIMTTASFADVTTYWPQIVNHELTHALQFFLAEGVQNGTGGPEGSPNAKWNGHFLEGSAQTVGMATAFPQIGWYSDEVDLSLRSTIKAFSKEVSIKNNKDAIAFFNTIEKREQGPSGEFAYAAGQILWEFYIGTYGFDKLLELYKNLPTTTNFNENLLKTIGINKEQFYKAAAPYFLRTWVRVSG